MEPKREYKDEKSSVLTCEKGEDNFLFNGKTLECCLRLYNKVNSWKTG